MRRRAGIKSLPETKGKPDHHLFVDSFFGFELPKDQPPSIQAVGPILSDIHTPLHDPIENLFLDKQCLIGVASECMLF